MAQRLAIVQKRSLSFLISHVGRFGRLVSFGSFRNLGRSTACHLPCKKGGDIVLLISTKRNTGQTNHKTVKLLYLGRSWVAEWLGD